MKRFMQRVYSVGILVYLGLVVRHLLAYGTTWRFGKFWTPTPILKPGVPVESIEGWLAVTGWLPYCHLAVVALFVAVVGGLIAPVWFFDWRLKRLRRELAAIQDLPAGEFTPALARIKRRYGIR
jgi:uncharacterized protein involved in cysteine biosynthesis